MCFYYAMVKTSAASLVENKVVKEEQLALFEDKHFVNGFEHPLMPVIASDKPGEIQLFHWGLVPKYMKTIEEANTFINKYSTLNAKGETLLTSRLYQEAARKRRCLVLCSGFFEWRHKTPGNLKSEKYPFYISLRNNELFVFAGIWEAYTDVQTGEIVNTYSVITTAANPMMEVVHNSKRRMPVIIEAERAGDWLRADLTEEEIQSFLKPYDAQKMKARSIAKINPRAAATNTPGVTAYYHYPELAEILDPGMFEVGGGEEEL